MDITMGLNENTEFRVTENTANVHSVEIKDNKATLTITLYKEELKELATAILDKLPLESKIDIMKEFAVSIGLYDDENPEFRIEDIEYNKTLDKLFFKVEEDLNNG